MKWFVPATLSHQPDPDDCGACGGRLSPLIGQPAQEFGHARPPGEDS